MVCILTALAPAVRAVDCNGNGIADSLDIAECTSLDLDQDGIPDECQIANGDAADCNHNGIIDWADVYGATDACGNALGGGSTDCNTDGVLDECQLDEGDCDGDGTLDVCEIRDNTQRDDNGNTIPDSCDLLAGAPDCNGNLVPDDADVRRRLGFDTAAYAFVPDTLPTYAVDVAIGDVTGDGKLDIVAVSEAPSGDSLGVFRNRSDGTFFPGTITKTGGAGYSLALTDIDGDHDLDVAMVQRINTSSPVTVLKNNGSGVFTVWTTIASGLFAIDVVAGDIDSDGDNDLVVGDTSHGGNILILKNNGEALFTVRTVISLGSGPLAFSLTDLDNDHDLDLVCLPENGVMAAFRNDGAGRFTKYYTRAFNDEEFPTAITTGDFNGDGLQDLVLAMQNNRAVAIVLNKGTTFQEREKFGPYAGSPVAVAAGDFDGDGQTDVAATMNPPTPNGPMSVMRGNGDGTLLGPTSYLAGDAPLALASGRLDADEKDDLAAAIYIDRRVRVWLNRSMVPHSRDTNHDGVPDECQCLVDINHDGSVTQEDLDAFLAAFIAGDLEADFNSSGYVDTEDFDAFIAAYTLGCAG